MTSRYLKNIRSMEELDALLEESLKKASTSAKKLLEEDVPEAIDSINRLCEDSISKIQKKSEQIINKISSSVETATSEILNETKAAQHEITRLVDDISDQDPINITTDMIAEVSHLSLNRISKCAKDSITEIESAVSQFVLELRKKTTDVFKEFGALAAKAEKNIREFVQSAGRTFRAAKKGPNRQQSLEQVKKDTERAVSEAENTLSELEKAKARTINRINEAMDAASRRIEQAYADATNEIRQAEEKSKLMVKEIIETAMRLYFKA